MAVDLPIAIERYFSAQRANDFTVLAQCFTASARVQDESRTIEGPDAIAKWMAEAKQKYHHSSEPLAVASQDGNVIVTARVSGLFPGSPIELRHIFKLAGDRIQSLQIGP